MKQFKKVKRNVAGVLAAVVATVSIPTIGIATIKAQAADFKEKEIALRFAVLSDLHLRVSETDTSAHKQATVKRYANAVATMNEMTDGNGLDMLLLAGDYGNMGTKDQARTFASATKGILDALKVKNGGKETDFIMAYGNHETEHGGESAHMSYSEWDELLREYNLFDLNKDYDEGAPNGCWHVKVEDGNGKTHHFFSLEIYTYANPTNMILTDALTWLDTQLETVTTEDPNSYVYLSCHGPAQESDVYGADIDFDTNAYWGASRAGYTGTATIDGVQYATSSDLDGVLKKYPQVVHFSGHYHYTNVLESTIMQKDYTAVQVAALSEGVAASSSKNGYYEGLAGTASVGWGIYVEVDKDGNQRMTRMEIRDNALVQTTLTYDTTTLNGTNIPTEYVTSVVIPESNNISPKTLKPWVMSAPKEDKSHLTSYSLATRKATPIWGKDAELKIENVTMNSDDSVTFDVTFDAIQKTDSTNYIMRYELELYDQNGNALNVYKKDKSEQMDKIWFLGNWVPSTTGVVSDYGTTHLDATKLSYSFSYSVAELDGASGIYAKLYAVDEFGGKSEPLTYGDRYTITKLTRMLPNGGFETGDLSNWTDGDSSVYSVDTTTVNSGTYSMAINRADSKTKEIRMDVNSVSAETEYKLSYSVNAAVASRVKAIVYEYSFNNKIVGMHEHEFYGPTSSWKQTEFTFTTSAAADKIGVVLETSGATGVVYIDDVTMTATGTETTQVSYDDSNGDGAFDVRDIVRMQRVLKGDTSVALAASKYADRNGDGEFTADDTGALRKKAVGVADDFIGVMATKGDIGAYGAKLHTTTTSKFPYVTTGKSYTDETFTFTAEYVPYSLAVGVRVPDAGNLDTDKQGVVIGIYDNFVEFYGGGLFSNRIGAASLLGGTLTSGETYVFSVQVTNNEDGTRTLYFEARQDSKLKAYFTHTFTADETYNSVSYLPESGEFVVWTRAYGEDAGQDVLYQIVEAEAPTSVVINEKGTDGIADISKDTTKGYGYLTLDGDYSKKHYMFTAKFADESDAGFLSVGLNKQSATPVGEMTSGLTVRLHNNYWTVYPCDNDNWQESKSANYYKPEGGTIALSTNVEYTFDFEVDGLEVTLRIYQGDALISVTTIGGETFPLTGLSTQGYSGIEVGEAYKVYDSGSFIVYTRQDTQEIAWKMPYTDMTAIEVEKDGTAVIAAKTSGSLSESGYLATESTYTDEYFEFTTCIADATNPNLVIGARMVGKSSNPEAYSGVNIRFATNSYSIYNGATLISTQTYGDGIALESRTEYTFGVDILGTKLHIEVEKGNVNIHYKEIELSSAGIPDSGYFMVWSQDAYRTIEYMMPITNGGAAYTIASADMEGKVHLGTIGNAKYDWWGSYLATENSYTSETFTFTTAIRDDATGNHPEVIIGVRTSNLQGCGLLTNGLIMSLQSISGNTQLVVWICEGAQKAHIIKNLGCILEYGAEYTFQVHMDGNELYLTIIDGDTVLADTSLIVDSTTANYAVDDPTFDFAKYTLPSSGQFAVWNKSVGGNNITWKTEPVKKTSVEIASDATDGSVTFSSKTANDITKSGYLATESTYTSEYFEVATTIVDASNPNFVLGARMEGKSSNPLEYSGLNIRFAADSYSLYNKDTLISTQSLGDGVVLESGTKYTFGVDVLGTTLHLEIKKDGATLHYGTVDVSSANLPTSGYFMAWSQDELRTIEYKVPMTNGDVNYTIPSDSTEGRVHMGAYAPWPWWGAPLATADSYTTETFTFDGSLAADDRRPLIIVGAHMDAADTCGMDNAGLVIGINSTTWQVQVCNGTTNIASSWKAHSNTLDLNAEYTFSVRVGTDNTVYLTVSQDGAVVSQGSILVDLSSVDYTPPTSGKFIVWNKRIGGNNITYKITE